jgi:hypothetical protein
MISPIQAGFFSQPLDGWQGDSKMMLPLGGGIAGVAAWLVCENGFIVNEKTSEKNVRKGIWNMTAAGSPL